VSFSIRRREKGEKVEKPSAGGLSRFSTFSSPLTKEPSLLEIARRFLAEERPLRPVISPGVEKRNEENQGAPARPPALLRLVLHEHWCPGCGRHFKCTAPSCAGKGIRCVVCEVNAIGNRTAAPKTRGMRRTSP